MNNSITTSKISYCERPTARKYDPARCTRNIVLSAVSSLLLYTGIPLCHSTLLQHTSISSNPFNVIVSFIFSYPLLLTSIRQKTAKLQQTPTQSVRPLPSDHPSILDIPLFPASQLASYTLPPSTTTKKPRFPENLNHGRHPNPPKYRNPTAPTPTSNPSNFYPTYLPSINWSA